MEVDLLEKAGVHSASAELSGPLYVGVYLNVSFFKSRFGRKMELESGKGISGQYALLVPPEESWGRGPELPLRASTSAAPAPGRGSGESSCLSEGWAFSV